MNSNTTQTKRSDGLIYLGSESKKEIATSKSAFFIHKKKTNEGELVDVNNSAKKVSGQKLKSLPIKIQPGQIRRQIKQQKKHQGQSSKERVAEPTKVVEVKSNFDEEYVSDFQ